MSGFGRTRASRSTTRVRMRSLQTAVRFHSSKIRTGIYYRKIMLLPLGRQCGQSGMASSRITLHQSLGGVQTLPLRMSSLQRWWRHILRWDSANTIGRLTHWLRHVIRLGSSHIWLTLRGFIRRLNWTICRARNASRWKWKSPMTTPTAALYCHPLSVATW